MSFDVSQAKPLLTISSLHKSFASPVLQDLNLTLFEGEIHALLGSNGAGKSTLCNIIAGIHQPTAGELTFDGQRHQPQNLNEAEAIGIRMVMQELSVFDNLSIAENICFKRFSASLGVIKQEDCVARAKAVLAKLGQSHIDVQAPLSSLGVGQKQLVEIARILDEPTRLLILDEPTASLTDPEIENLFTQLEALRAQGVCIIYISHRMDEIKRIANRVSVLRDGKLIATEDAKTADTDALIEKMAGQAIQASTRGAMIATKPLVRVKAFTRAPVFQDINLQINRGEVLGIGGLMGAGRTELLRCLFGADKPDSGRFEWLDGSDRQSQPYRSPKQALAQGLVLVVEDRKQQGLLLSHSIAANMGLSVMQRFIQWLGKYSSQAQLESATPFSDQLAIKCDSLDQSVAELSGGNQQKALIGRALMTGSALLMFDEPSRGVDANAKATIQRLIREQAAAGKAVVVVSSETQELLNVSDRIAIMSNGRLAGEFDATTVSEQELVAASFRFHTQAS